MTALPEIRDPDTGDPALPCATDAEVSGGPVLPDRSQAFPGGPANLTVLAVRAERVEAMAVCDRNRATDDD